MFNLTSTSSSLTPAVSAALTSLEDSICEAATTLRGALVASGWVTPESAKVIMAAYVQASDDVRADYSTYLQAALQVSGALRAHVEVSTSPIVAPVSLANLATMAEFMGTQDPADSTRTLVADALTVLDSAVRECLTSLEATV